MEKMLSVAQVAEWLGRHETTIHNWIREGCFPGAFKMGPGKTSPYAIPEEDVVAFIEARRQEAQKQRGEGGE